MHNQTWLIKTAERDAASLQSKAWGASDNDKVPEQPCLADDRELEDRLDWQLSPTESPAPKTVPVHPMLSQYIAASHNANQRVEELEKENLRVGSGSGQS